MSRGTDVSCTCNIDESIHGQKLIYPAATRNQEPIFQVLKQVLRSEDLNGEKNPLFLEIASGSGQHVAYFAPKFPWLKFQPTEVDEQLLGSITYYANNCETKNILPPKLVDIQRKLSIYGFMENSIYCMYNANMIHISPYECTIGLFENAGSYLKPDGLLITYGPYSKDGIITPESNIQFHASLRSRNPAWGLRDINDLIQLAKKNSLILINTFDMPANNKTLIWKKISN